MWMAATERKNLKGIMLIDALKSEILYWLTYWVTESYNQLYLNDLEPCPLPALVALATADRYCWTFFTTQLSRSWQQSGFCPRICLAASPANTASNSPSRNKLTDSGVSVPSGNQNTQKVWKRQQQNDFQSFQTTQLFHKEMIQAMLVSDFPPSNAFIMHKR